MSLLLLALVLTGASVQSDACTSVGSCAFFVNNGSGPGVESTSTTGFGVVGRTKASDGNRTTYVAGVYGESETTSAGPFFGVFGFSASKGEGFGVVGEGNIGVAGLGQRLGVLGMASLAQGKDAGVEGYGPAGVIGFGVGPSPGVFGLDTGHSNDSFGVEGLSQLAGVHGQGPIGVVATTNTQHGGVALQLEPANEALALVSIGPFGRATASLDSSGDLTLAGKLTLSGAPLSNASTSSGTRFTAYGDRTARPLLEDVGEGHLVSGNATVQLDPRFAALVDAAKPYMVFVTPDGDSNGIFVARRSPTDFLVRENRHGRSTLTFQYRIVATPLDTQDRRLPAAADVPGIPGLRRHETVPNFEIPKNPLQP